jgi:cell wall-associated NlpC family hydrolase
LDDATKPSSQKLLTARRTQMMTAAKALIATTTHYTQDAVKRWNGITKKEYPPNAPVWSDCSSAVSWIYWTVFGGGSDFLNGQAWKAGYTGTQTQHGKSISLSNAQHGDLVFYGGTTSVPSHVAMWVGDGYVVSHGSEQAQCLSVHYRSDINQVRCYVPNECNSVEEEVLV